MSQTITIEKTSLLPKTEVSFMEILQEIQEIPRENWVNLLQILKAFKQATTTDKSSELIEAKIPKDIQIEKNKAAIELLQLWIKEGDEKEQTETFEYLQKYLID